MHVRARRAVLLRRPGARPAPDPVTPRRGDAPGLARRDRRIRLLEGEARTVWTAARPAVLPGEPVALHERYGVLAAGRERVNVALIDA